MIRQNRSSRTKGLKSLLSAAAVAATLGGWTALSIGNPPPAPEVVVPQAQVELPPIPTIVPLLATTIDDHTASTARQVPELRDVNVPPAVSRPAPIVITRSSR